MRVWRDIYLIDFLDVYMYPIWFNFVIYNELRNTVQSSSTDKKNQSTLYTYFVFILTIWLYDLILSIIDLLMFYRNASNQVVILAVNNSWSNAYSMLGSLYIKNYVGRLLQVSHWQERYSLAPDACSVFKNVVSFLFLFTFSI